MPTPTTGTAAEGLGLYIGSGAVAKTMPLVLQSVPEGIKHFTNWDNGLISLDETSKERFEINQPTEYMGYSFGANKIKIVDDIAVISYGNFTDINKVVWQDVNGGMYDPFSYTSITSYSGTVRTFIRLSDNFFLPILDKSVLNATQYGLSQFDNLFILVEYDGYYSDVNGNIVTRSLDLGDKELFSYSATPTGDPGKFYFDDNFDFIILSSKYNTGGRSDDISFGPTNPRALTPHVSKDIERLDQIRDNYNTSSPGTNIAFGFLGYSKVSIIKYTPVVECGKIDIYLRKSGKISQVKTNGVVVSAAHDLQNGDMIKISNATSTLNGFKYVQTRSSTEFIIYEDQDFTTRTETSNFSSVNYDWVLVGSVTDNTRQGWSFETTLMSPTGRNGYRGAIPGLQYGYNDTGKPLNGQIPQIFNGVSTYQEMVDLDLGENLDDPFDSNIPVRTYSTMLDAVWAGPDWYTQSYRFGCDIDFKKINGQYKILVGERGPDEYLYYDNTRLIPPEFGPYGKIHLIDISFDLNKVLSITLDSTYDASTYDSSISIPQEMHDGSFDQVNFYKYQTDSSANTGNSNLFNYTQVQQYVYGANSYSQSNFLVSNYWYGAMLLHIPENRYGIKGFGGSNNPYFSDTDVHEFGYYNLPVTDLYPYVDSFGKSVALDYVNGNIAAIASSKVKTVVPSILFYVDAFGSRSNRGNPSTLSASDSYKTTYCGYIHVKIGTSTQKISRSTATMTASGTYGPQELKAEKMANTLVAENGKLYWGQSKVAEINSLPIDFSYETSRIYIYTYNSTSYVESDVILNENDDYYSYFYFDSSKKHSLKYKEDFLRNQLVFSEFNKDQGYIFPTDRFGDYFVVEDETIITNSLDRKNEYGVSHFDTQEEWNTQSDYLHIYVKKSGIWRYSTKISATIDSLDEKYSYEDYVHPNFYGTLRVLGNISYSNTSPHSRTWDIDLTNRYAVIDNRIFLKDPLGYAIFNKSWAPVEYSTSDIETTKFSPVECNYYFKYVENFNSSYTSGISCGLFHTKYDELFKYIGVDTVFYSQTPSSKIAKSPVYFFSVPSDSVNTSTDSISITITTTRIAGSFDPVLNIYRKEPRVSIDPAYVDNSIYGGCTPSGDYVRGEIASPYNYEPYKNGSLDVETYEFTGDTLYDEKNSIQITGVKSGDNYTYTISKALFHEFFENRTKLISGDTSKATYNASVPIKGTMMIGFTFAKTNYSIENSTVVNQELSILDIDFKISKTLIARDTNNRPYDCIVSKVAEYTDKITEYSLDGILEYTNPVFGIGTSNLSTTYDYAIGINPGRFSKSYQILSVDNTETITAIRSLDTPQIDAMPLFMSTNLSANSNIPLVVKSSVQQTQNTTLFTGGIMSSLGSIPMFIGPLEKNISLNLTMSKIVGPNSNLIPLNIKSGIYDMNSSIEMFLKSPDMDGGITLYLEPPEPSSGQSELYISGPIGSNSGTTLVLPYTSKTIATLSCDAPTLYLNATYGLTSTATLEITGLQPVSMDMVILGPVESNLATTLFISKYDEANSSVDLSIYPSTLQSGSTTLAFYENPTTSTTLFIEGPEQNTGSSDLFIQYNPVEVNSISNAPYNYCLARDNDSPFDVSSGYAEYLIGQTNSIAREKYTSDTEFSYHDNSPLISIKTAYDFYKNGRFRKNLDSNTNTLVLTSIEDRKPVLYYFGLDNKQASFQERYDIFSSVIHELGLKTQFQEANYKVLDVKISSTGLVAASMYVEILNSSNDIVRYINIVFIVDNGVILKSFYNTWLTSSQEEYLSNQIGISLEWKDNDLYYPKAQGYYDVIKYRSSADNYATESQACSFSNLPGALTYESCWSTGKIDYTRMAFGHKIKIVNDKMFISCPLYDVSAGISVPSTPRKHIFEGAIFVFTYSGGVWTYSSTINAPVYGIECSGKFYGYDFDYDFNTKTFAVGEPGDLTIYRYTYDTIFTYVSTNVGSDTFGMNVVVCNNFVYTILTNTIYNIVTQDTYQYNSQNIPAELDEYIPANNILNSYSETLKYIIISNDMMLAGRLFTYSYGLSINDTVFKISALKDAVQSSTPSLFIKAQGSDSFIPLYYAAPENKIGEIPLFIRNELEINSGMSMYFEADVGSKAIMPLAIKVTDPINVGASTELNIYGSTVSGLYTLYDDVNLYINAPNSPGVSESSPLVMMSSSTGDSNRDASLYINNIVDAGNAYNNVGLSIVNTQTVAPFGTPYSATSLYLNSTYGQTGSMPLVLHRRSTSGNLEIENDVNLVIGNNTEIDNITLLINAASNSVNNMMLFIKPGNGTGTTTLNTFIRGYEE